MHFSTLLETFSFGQSWQFNIGDKGQARASDDEIYQCISLSLDKEAGDTAEGTANVLVVDVVGVLNLTPELNL